MPTTKPPLIHVASQVFGVPLAILPDKLDIVLRALGPRLVPDQSAISRILDSGVLRTRNSDLVAYWDDGDDDPAPPRKDKKPYSQTPSGIAVIPVKGILMKSGGWMCAISGFSSYEGIGKACSAAMEDPSVRAVLFDIDSPGGTTHGCFELCDLLHSYRGRKPMWSIANDLAASAAYAIASSTDRVLLTRTAGVGSIGVFCLHLDCSTADAKEGVKYTYVFAGEHKVDGNEHEPLSKSAKASIQSEVDRSYDMFVSTVSRNRGVKSSLIVATQAEVLFAGNAVPLLADAVGSYDDAVAELTSKVISSSATISVSKANVDMAATDAILDVTSGTAKSSVSSSTGVVETDVVVVDGKTYKAYLPARRSVTSIVAAPASAPPFPPKEGEEEEEEDDEAKACDNPDHPNGCDHSGGAESKPPADSTSSATATATSTTTSIPKVILMPATADTAPVSAPASAAPAFTFTVEMATEIADLCAMVGQETLAARFIREKTPVPEVRKQLIDARAKASSDLGVNSSFGSVSTDALANLQRQADTLVANSGGTMLQSKALETVLKRNPAAYDAYENERAQAALTPAGSRAYVIAAAQRMATMGLSTEMGANYNRTSAN